MTGLEIYSSIKKKQSVMPRVALSAAMLFTAACLAGCGNNGTASETAPVAETAAGDPSAAKAAESAISDLLKESSAEAAETSSESVNAGKETEAVAADKEENADGNAEAYTVDSGVKAAQDDKVLSDMDFVSDAKSYGESLSREDVFRAMSGWLFEFASGAGAWQTYMTVDPDGTFAGQFTDSNLGETGEGYEEYGTTYISEFAGTFTDAKQIAPYIYELHFEEPVLTQEPGKEVISDGMRLVYSEPYGMHGTDSVTVFLPGTPLEDLPEEYLNWIAPLHFGCYIRDSYYTDLPEDLPFCGIYNEENDAGFFSAGRYDRNPLYLINRASWADLVPQKEELHEDGTYRFEDMDRAGMHEVINICFKAEAGADGKAFPAMDLYPKSFVLRCLDELGCSPDDEDTLYYFTMDDAEWYAPILYINGREGVYAFWTTGANEDTRSWSARMTQIGDYVYVYALGLCQYEELLAGEAAHFFHTSLTFSGRPDRLSSAPEKAEEELRSIFAAVEPAGEDTLNIRELVFVGTGDEHLIAEYGLDPEEMDDDYAIVQKHGEIDRTLSVAENCPIYVQYPEEGTFRSLITYAELSDYCERFERDNVAMTLILDENDRVVFMYQNYTP